MPNKYIYQVALAESISQFGLNFLNTRVVYENYLNIVPRTALILFCHLQSDLDGVIKLLNDESRLQPNTAQLQLRTMFEGWLYISLVATKDGEEWAKYFEIISQNRIVKRAKKLHAASVISQDELSKIASASEAIIKKNRANFQFPALPLFAGSPNQDNEIIKFEKDILGIITDSSSSRKKQLTNQLRSILASKQKKPRDFFKKPIDIIEMCEIIDYYTPPAEGSVSHVEWYESIYRHLSDYAHGDLGNASSVTNVQEDSVTTNIAGDSEYAPKLLHSAMIIYLGSLEYVASILKIDIQVSLKDFSDRIGL